MSPTRHVFEYAVLRAVPRVERGEAINVAVLLYCRAFDYLAARRHVEVERLLALDPSVDVDAVTRAVDAASDCAPAADEDIGRRFRWLTAPRSTVVQPGPVHTGLTADPDAELERLFSVLVLPPAATAIFRTAGPPAGPHAAPPVHRGTAT